MPVTYDITHTTHYQYVNPVELNEHRVLFRPRDSHDVRVLATDMIVTPPPAAIRLIQDSYSNSVALVQPQSPADELKVVCTFTVEHAGLSAVEFPLSPNAQSYPFSYDAEESLVLAHYMTPFYDDPDRRLLQWAQQFVEQDGAANPRELLVKMTAFIHRTMNYQVRYDEGVQTPHETLELQSGACRDFATLMIEAIRHLGYAARFVSGYLYTPALDGGEDLYLGAGSTHAWLQAYLPGPGWISLDPTNNLAGGSDLIPVGVARHASLAPPVSGSWGGLPGEYKGMFVDVQVRKRADSPPAEQLMADQNAPMVQGMPLPMLAEAQDPPPPRQGAQDTQDGSEPQDSSAPRQPADAPREAAPA